MAVAITRPVDDDLLQRCAGLKRELVEYASHNRFGRAYRQLCASRAEDGSPLDEFGVVNTFDYFALQHRLHDGRTVVERFVAENRRLTEDDRALLLGWRDVVECVFEVQGKQDGALVTVNMLDEMRYRIYSNFGCAFVDDVPDGSFLAGRVVPLSADWIVSGEIRLFPPEAEAEVCWAVAQLATRNPEAVYRNPDKLARGWEMQRAERAAFVEFFGSDLVVLAPGEFADRMRAFDHYKIHERCDEDGCTIAERARERTGTDVREVGYPVPNLDGAPNVGVVYDEVGGIMYWLGYGDVQHVFAHPELAEEHHELVLGYLEDDSVSPVALRRLAEPDAGSATRVWRTVLGRPEFEWSQDGEALLREYKPEWFDRPDLPCVSVISERVGDALRVQRSTKAKCASNVPVERDI